MTFWQIWSRQPMQQPNSWVLERSAGTPNARCAWRASMIVVAHVCPGQTPDDSRWRVDAESAPPQVSDDAGTPWLDRLPAARP